MNKELLLFIAYIGGALILSAIPLVHWPLSWLETYFHELSHGIAATITGGEVDRIELYLSGGGKCFHRGGWIGFTAFSGYMGAILWGAVIYIAAQVNRKSARVLGIVFAVLIVLTMLFWARDAASLLILGIIAILFVVLSRHLLGRQSSYVLEFIGIYVLVNALRSPFALIDGRNIGDAATLSQLYYLPEFVWIAIWVIAGVVTLIVLFNMQRSQ